MANIKGLVSQYNATFGSDGDYKEVRQLREGSLSVADFKFVSVMAGRGFMINVGAFSTGIVGGGNGTVLDADQPEFVISCPTGTSIIPVRIDVSVQTGAPADGQEVEILVAVDQDKAHDATGTSTAETIYNMNTLKGLAAQCKAYSAFTANCTAPVLDLELARRVIEYDVAANGEVGVELALVYEPITPPILNGPCMIVGHWGGDTATVGGFATVQWLEYPTTIFNT